MYTFPSLVFAVTDTISQKGNGIHPYEDVSAVVGLGIVVYTYNVVAG
jgi:hypothetical protein